MNLAPIILFTYRRPNHAMQTVEALLKNKEASASDLIIYSDGPKGKDAEEGVKKTREYIRTITGFKSIQIIERAYNWGLANSIIDGVTSVINKYGKGIVVEDDLITSPYFLQYMNEALDLYQDCEEVISIHGYMYPVKKEVPESFFIKTADCWGWGTWKRGWALFNPNSQELLDEIVRKRRCREFNFNNSYPYTEMLEAQIRGEVDSWAIRWYASALVNDKLTLYPKRSLVFQNGMDGIDGTHCGEDTRYIVELSQTPIVLEKLEMKESKKARKAMTEYFVSLLPKKTRKKRFWTNLFSFS
jgi:hypothetical protein